MKARAYTSAAVIAYVRSPDRNKLVQHQLDQIIQIKTDVKDVGELEKRLDFLQKIVIRP